MSLTVTAIVPTYNRADLIAETLDTLLEQTRRPDEILVVNDGSSDGTGDVVRSYEPHLHQIEKPNGGKASALNLALSQARGDLIWICDDDDLLLPGTCETLAGLLETEPALDFVCGQHEDFTVDRRTGEKQLKPPGFRRASAPDEIFFDLLDGCHIFQPALMVRRQLYDRLGPFREDLVRSQDYEMMLRIARGGTGRLLEETVYLHREHTGARGSGEDRFAAAEAFAKWIRYDRMIFGPLLADLEPRELLPASYWNDPAHGGERERTAALKRASVRARHQMWPEALGDWQEIAARYEGPMNDFERLVTRRATLHMFGCDPLFEDRSLRDAVRQVRSASPLGRAIAGELARSVAWQARKAAQAGRFARAMAIARFIAAARF